MTTLTGALKAFDPSSDDIESWVRVFNQFVLANDLDPAKHENRIRALFLSSLGLPTFTLLHDLISPDEPDKKTLKDLISVLQKHFKPPSRALAERFKFTGRKQQEGETVSAYLADLRKLAVTCKFTNLSEHLRDQFVCGLRSEQAQKQIFQQDDDVSLDKVVKIATSVEMAAASTSLVRGPEQGHSNSNGASDVNKAQSNRRKPNQTETNQPKKKGNSKSCPNCGSNNHSTSKDCPHKNIKCHKCGKLGHFAKLCRSKGQSSTQGKTKEHSVSSVFSVSTTKDFIEVEVNINGKPHTMELDTGCKTSLLSEDFWKQSLGSPPLLKSTRIFSTYTKEKFYARGQFQCELTYNDQKVRHTFHVVKGQSLFGRDLLKMIKLDWTQIQSQCNSVSETINLNTLLNEFKDIFQAPTEADKIQKFKAKVVLREDATPKFLKARPVPFALRSKVDAELIRMEEAGVIEKVEHSDWASPLVVVPKSNGKVRITGDFKNTVNPQLHITQYPLPRVEDLLSSFTGGSKFSKLDAPDAFHQIEVEDYCKKFLVINTHRGLYRYNVLPMGIASSPAIFQEFMDKLLAEIPMAESFQDDVLVSGKDDQVHLATLKQIFLRMRDTNYRLSKSKCQFLESQVEYVGYQISKKGIHTSPSKILALQSIQQPCDVSEVRSFLGLVNFYGSFVPTLSDLCDPLYALTRKDTVFKWTNKCQSAFELIKRKLSSAETLVHFDQTKPIGISCDASPIGLGVVLFHRSPEGHELPIAYASKSLSPTERRYSQIEREGLSIVYGLKKFFQYLCGKKFTLVTDHKPLVAIFGSHKHLPPLVANRLHRWALYLSGFTFDIVYRSTKEHGNADALSRFPVKDDSTVSMDVDCEVNSIVELQLGTLPVNVKSIRKFSSRDKVLSQVYKFIESGWKCINKDDPLYPYFLHRTEFSIIQGVIMWGIRVVVPKALQNKLLEELHSTHAGIVRMNSLARQFMWWPGIDANIEHLAKTCVKCCSIRHNPPSAPLHPWAFPERPWQRIYVDLAGPFFNSMWLVIVDAHSKWPEVFKLPNATSEAVILRMRETFCRFGIPEQLVSDNGTQFTSDEFQEFCKLNGVRHTTSAVYHPRSNGEAERFIQTFKEAMKTDCKNKEYLLQKFLMTYRITPHSTTNSSPSELLLGRRIRCVFDLVRPDPRASASESQLNQKETYDKRSKPREFQVGQQVWAKTYSKNEPKWTPGTLTSSTGPVSFNVSVDGRTMKRHVDQLYAAQPLEPNSADVPPPSPPKTPAVPRSPPNASPVVASPHSSISSWSSATSPDASRSYIDLSSDSSPERFRKSTRRTKQPDFYQA